MSLEDRQARQRSTRDLTKIVFHAYIIDKHREGDGVQHSSLLSLSSVGDDGEREAGAAVGFSLVGVALHVRGLLGFLRLALARVLAELRQGVGLGPHQQRVLRRLHVLWPAGPCLQAGVLQRPGVGEGDVPRVGALVHGVQVQGGLHLGLPAGEELFRGTGTCTLSVSKAGLVVVASVILVAGLWRGLGMGYLP